MRFLLASLLFAAPAFAASNAHTGIIHPRTGPELSDIALFLMGAGGVWVVRRAMRMRFSKSSATKLAKD